VTDPFEIRNFVDDRVAGGNGDREAADVVGDSQCCVSGIQESITGEDAVADVVEGEASGRVGVMGVADHDDDRIVLIDKGRAV
jgi:hypothetical protein